MENKWKCRFCDKSYESKNSLHIHYVTKHLNLDEEISTPELKEKVPGPEASMKVISSPPPQKEPEVLVPELSIKIEIEKEKEEAEDMSLPTAVTSTTALPEQVSPTIIQMPTYVPPDVYAKQLWEEEKKLKDEEKKKEDKEKGNQEIKQQLNNINETMIYIKGMICDTQGNCRIPTREEIQKIVKDSLPAVSPVEKPSATERPSHKSIKDLLDCPTCNDRRKNAIREEAKSLLTNEDKEKILDECLTPECLTARGLLKASEVKVGV